MKTVPLLCLTAVLLLAGCFQSPRPATQAAAESFASMLLVELSRVGGGIEENGGGSGRAGKAYTRDFFRLLPAESFPPEQLFAVAKSTMAKWSQHQTHSTQGSGGGGNRFHLHFGDGRSHAFIDVVAYPHQGKTRVDIQLRGVE
jgi:hypothetical protein